jgi:hypothetical protein
MKPQSNRIVRGPQTAIAGVAANGNGPKSAAQRAKEYRESQKRKREGLQQRAAFATMQQPGGALPVQTTAPDDKGDPGRWSSIPTIEPAPPDPNAAPATNADGTPAAPSSAPNGPQPVVTTAGKRRPPTEQEEASAEKLGEKLARFWSAGGEIVGHLYEQNVKNDPNAHVVVKTWMKVLVDEWRDKDTRKMVKAAGAQLAIDWGLATTLSPPPVVVVLGAVALSGGAHLVAMAIEKEKAEARGAGGASSPSSAPAIDVTASERSEEPTARALDDDETESTQPYPQNWGQFGLKRGAAS